MSASAGVGVAVMRRHQRRLHDVDGVQDGGEMIWLEAERELEEKW